MFTYLSGLIFFPASHRYPRGAARADRQEDVFNAGDAEVQAAGAPGRRVSTYIMTTSPCSTGAAAG